MPQDVTLTRFVVLAQLQEADPQNPQELASVWGDVRSEAEDIDIEVQSTYAVLGEFDFLAISMCPRVRTRSSFR